MCKQLFNYVYRLNTHIYVATVAAIPTVSKNSKFMTNSKPFFLTHNFVIIYI